MQDIPFKVLVVRRTLPSLRRTCIPLFEERAKLFHAPYKLNKSEFSAVLNKSIIYFLSMNHKEDYEKVKSITDVDIIWLEEANELSEFGYDLLNLRLRGGKGDYRQFIMSFNPIGTTSWIYDKFFERNEKSTKLHYTVYDNPWADEEYVEILEGLEKTNQNLFKVYCLGEWGRLEGVIYENWSWTHFLPNNIDDIIYGLDFGYNNPSALVRIYISDQRFFLEQLLYETHLTNNDLIAKMKRMNIDPSDKIYCDNAEPDRIEEIERAGFSAYPADKEVLSGIDFCQAQELHVLYGSEELGKELNSYVWEVDKDNKPLDKPVKFNDHLCDAMRYGIYTHCAKQIEARVRIV